MDNTISATAVIAGSTVYPMGTPEQFPLPASNGAGAAVYTSAHYYMECSNKGICDRTTGECDCFDGYDGAACQRASCPNDCSGHGTCETISDLAFKEFGNSYALWDKDASMGCKCDAGYGAAADCSQRQCKVGVDPLYIDDTPATYTKSLLQIHTTLASELDGTFTMTFYDVYGEDYVTAPIAAKGSAVGLSDNICANIKAALQALPNKAVPDVTCAATAFTTNQGYDVELTFTSNPGYLKPFTVDSTEVVAAGGFTVNTAGLVAGEATDHFASKCSTVSAVLTNVATPTKAGAVGYLTIANAAHIKLLKACLGDSDGDVTNNVDVFNWDHGALNEFAVQTATTSTDAIVKVIGSHPHAIKAVPIAGGVSQMNLLWYDSSATAGEEFRLASAVPTSAAAHYIHTTDGIVQQLGFDRRTAYDYIAGTPFQIGSFKGSGVADGKMSGNKTEVRVVGYFAQYDNKVYTNIDASCESSNSNLAGLHNCIQKGDKLFIIDGCWGNGGTPDQFFGGQTSTCTSATGTTAPYAAGGAFADVGTGNYMYTVNKIYSKNWDINTDAVFPDADEADLLAAAVAAYPAVTNPLKTGTGGTPKENRFVIEVDHNINWDGNVLANPGYSADAVNNSGFIVLFKFTPAAGGKGSYTYVSECSNRGACDRESGLCQCFKGYTSDNCSVQSSLAV